jgi:hypothetical protein
MSTTLARQQLCNEATEVAAGRKQEGFSSTLKVAVQALGSGRAIFVAALIWNTIYMISRSRRIYLKYHVSRLTLLNHQDTHFLLNSASITQAKSTELP